MDKYWIKQRKKELKGTIDSFCGPVPARRNNIVSEEKSAKIDLAVCSECFCPYSIEEALSEDVFDYLREKTNLYPSILPLTLCLHGCADEEQFNRICRNIRRHYKAEMVDVLWDQKLNRRHFVAMFVLGLAVVSLSISFAYFIGENLMFEALSLFGSFALWEAADAFLVQRREIHRRLLETAQMLTMEIVCEEGGIHEQDK